MTALIWVLPLSVLAVVAFGYYINWDRLIEIARTIQNQKLFTAEEVLPARGQLELAPLNEEGEVRHSAFKQAISALTDYVRDLNPDWIVGVHPGGRLLSVLIAHELEKQSRCLYVATNQNRTLEIVPPQNAPLQGRMLLIDDISRTGRTLNFLKSKLTELNYSGIFHLDRIYIAALYVETLSTDPEGKFKLDWAFQRTEKRLMKLPWSKLTSEIGNAYTERNANRHHDEAVVAEFKRISQDFEYAYAIARKFAG